MRQLKDEHEKSRGVFLDFVKVLKEADVRVSPAEILDMFTALQHVDFTNRPVFRQTLGTTLIKDYTDLPVFDRCFREFFEKKSAVRGFDIDAAMRDTLNLNSLMDTIDLSEDELLELQSDIDEYLDSLPDDILFRRNARDILSMILDDPVIASSSGALGMMIMNARSRNASVAGNDDDGSEENDPITRVLLPRIRRRIAEKTIGRNIHRREDFLLHRPLYQLKPHEVQEMRELVRRFGQKLKNRISLRKKKVKHGGLDIKRTLRFNLKHGGTPFKLYFRNRKIDRPQLVILCDISSSVNQYSRFMLLLTYMLQGLFSKVRTFAFISSMVEITPLFMEMDPEKALNSIFTDTDFTYGFGSNYGRCFTQFIHDYSNSLTRKTTVLILGDARNNNQDPGLDAFIKIRERCRNLFWLNPDRRHLWDWSDSIATLYMPHCTEMKEVNSFLDLSEFIDRLFIK